MSTPPTTASVASPLLRQWIPELSATRDDEQAVSIVKLAPCSPKVNEMRFAMIEAPFPVPVYDVVLPVFRLLQSLLHAPMKTAVWLPDKDLVS